MNARFAHRRVVLALVLPAAILPAGCEMFGRQNPAAATALRDDIVAIRQYYSTQPWIWDPEGRANGILARVYFLPTTDPQGHLKGVFVSGVIRAQLHALSLRPDGTYIRDPLHEWVMPPDEASGFRTVKPSILGDSYAFVLRWPSEIKIAGREIQITFSYERRDGRTISQPSARFRVPMPGAVQTPPATQPVVRPGRSSANTPPPGAAPPAETSAPRKR
jgi:hypothetical protein